MLVSHIRLRISLLLAVVVAYPALGAVNSLPEKIEYNRDIRPILGDNCFKCHGFDKNHREGDRRLDTPEGATADNDGIRALVSGDLEASDVHVRIRSTDEDEVMPPPKAARQLTDRQKALLDRWIEQGAEYQPHWAYLPPTKSTPPSVEEPGFTKNEIDRFVLARQRDLEIAHSLEADRATLCRRLSLDIIGLPPTVAEVEAFENDTSPDAYEKLVDRLLASPHYGERMAVYWLDLVRFADTIGYHSDNPRNIWPYRDWVINSFNDNKRFDRFTIEQVAGDLIPNATQQNRIASAFNRLNMTTEEGGAQPKQYEAKTVTDRVKAIGTGWLAQTFMCCECHDHKFDPVTARDFYSMGAFFADIKENAIGGRESGMIVASPEMLANVQAQEDLLASQRQVLNTSTPEIEASQAAWEEQVKKESAPSPEWTLLEPTETSAQVNKTPFVVEGPVIRATGEAPDRDTYRITVKTPLTGVTGFRLEALPDANLPHQGPGRASNGNFILSEFSAEKVEADGSTHPISLVNATSKMDPTAFPAIQAIDGQQTELYSNGWGMVTGDEGKEHAIYFETGAPVGTEGESTLVFTLRFNYGAAHLLGKFRLAATTSAPLPARAPEVKPAPGEVLDLLKIAPAQRNPEQSNRVAAYYRTFAPQLAQMRNAQAAAELIRTDTERKLVRCQVTEHMDPPRVVRILPRGDFTNETGDIVKPAVPKYLSEPAFEGRDLTRMDLAEWLISKKNPLTARVFVNRLWKMFYCIGLSKTIEDLGTQGEAPANQALLDWLACEFMDSGWDVKHMVRLMATSGVYRESSAATPEQLEADPFNRELARQSLFRLDAEFVRDNALAISGLLKPAIGGPSVKPYQPAGYWENLNFPTREWQSDTNDNEWRRGLYTWWQRSYLQPSLLAFDASTREECIASRNRSNIPQQALVLLNDPTYVEAARAFAARIVQQGGAGTDDRINWAWKQAELRSPHPDETAVLRGLYEKHLSEYKTDPAAATALLAVGYAPKFPDLDPAELAAWTNVARTILNLHETITRF